MCNTLYCLDPYEFIATTRTCDLRLLAAMSSISLHSANSASLSAASQMLPASPATWLVSGLQSWRVYRGWAAPASTCLMTHPGSSTAPLGRVSCSRLDSSNSFSFLYFLTFSDLKE